MKKVTLLFALMAVGILSAAAADAGPIGNFTLSPEPGEVAEIGSVKITFPDTGIMGLDYNVEFEKITLTCSDGTKFTATDGDVVDEYATFKFVKEGETASAPITDPGEYTLSIPEGTFKKFRATDKYNTQITEVYTIAGEDSNSLSNYILTPASGTLSSIDGINIKFPDTGIMGIDESGCEGVTFTRRGSTSYKVVKSEYGYGDDQTMYFGIEQDNPLTLSRPGIYDLVIPAGTFAAYRKDETNSKITATYEIVNPEFNSMAVYTTVPASDSDLTQFQYFEINFSDAEPGLEWPIDSSKISLSAEVNGVTAKYVPVQVSMQVPYKTVTLGFSTDESGEPQLFTSSGNYTIEIREGAFKESESGYSNGNINIPFTVTNADDYQPFASFICEPTEGNTVGELGIINITFPDVDEGGLDWPIDASVITLQREGDDTIYYGNSPMLSQGKTLILGFGAKDSFTVDQRTFRAEGKYTVTIPAGTLSDSGNSTISNSEIILQFFVNPELNFRYNLLPDCEKRYSELSGFHITGDNGITEITLNSDCRESATLSNEETEYVLTGNQEEKGVDFLLGSDAEITPGEWLLHIPAKFLKGINEFGKEISNPEPIEALYTVKEPEVFNFATDPSDGAEIPMFGKFTVSFEGNPKAIRVNEDAGIPLLKGEEEYELNYAISINEISFAPNGGAALSDGEYTITIPEGFIETEDADELVSPVKEITVSFTISAPDWQPFDTGMLILNEGWFGHDNASLTHISSEGDIQYNAFSGVNPNRALGVTGQYMSRYGNRLFVVSKQSGKNINGIMGGLLTMADAETLAYSSQLNTLGKGIQARAFCAVSEEKGYLSASNAIYPIDLQLMSIGEPIRGTENIALQYGEMLRYHGRVFSTAKNWDLLVIDPETDTFQSIDCEPLSTLFVAADGSMWAATLDESAEFVKIDPELLTIEPLKVKAEEGVQTKITNNWTTWKAAPIAADKDVNAVYYATSGSATQIARVDLETGNFIPDFIKLPATESAQTCIYGQAISVDPLSGEIVINAVESGWGTHSQQNYVFRADPKTGDIIADKTLHLSENYWFPAMSIYCGYEAPEITLTDIALEPDGAVDLRLPEYTTLKMGNPYMIEYSISSSDTSVCEIDRLAWGRYLIRTAGEGECTLTVSADFNGLITTTEVKASTPDSVIGIMDNSEITGDIYTMSGILIKRVSTSADLENLPAGIYICNGKKIVKR